MTRNILTTAVRRAAERCGIGFYTGELFRINNELKVMPALWLHPPQITNSEGCEEGVVFYQIEMELLPDSARSSSEEREKNWAQLETMARSICQEINRDEHIKSGKITEFMSRENTLTNRGEISAHLKMKVEIPFFTTKKDSVCI